MMDDKTFFIFERPHGGALSETSAAIYEATREQNWLDDAENNVAVFCDSPRAEVALDHGIEHTIPVGGVDFVNTFLRRCIGQDVRALNVPPELNTADFTGRGIWPSLTKEEVIALSAEGTPLLLKPARMPKLFEATPYSAAALRELPDNEPLFVSELLPKGEIVAEWRAFVERGRLVDIRPYVLDDWKFPDQETLDGMCSAMARYAAVTIDVGVLRTGETIVLEAHNFLSCGLYGFSGAAVLRMTKAAWRWELTENS